MKKIRKSKYITYLLVLNFMFSAYGIVICGSKINSNNNNS